MMKALFFSLVSLTAVSTFAAKEGVELNKPVKDMEMTDTNGKKHKISDFKGKIVVMEWTNYGCPFVRKHYDSKNMQALQAQAKKDGVVWLTVVSSAPKEQGYYEPAAMNAQNKKEGNEATATILDPTGVLGRYFDAKTTPHMYIVNKKGELAYKGGIDNTKSTEAADVKTAKNFVKLALADLQADRKVEKASTDEYGCAIKFAKK